jgi:chromate transporter
MKDLAGTFLLVGATSFGGGLTGYLRRALVEERRWLTEEEFLRGLSIAQAVPGPNAVNLAVFVGHRFHGVPGSLVAVGSVFVVPLAALSLLAVGWARWGAVPSVVGALATLAAFGAALMTSTGIAMFRAAKLRRTELLVAAASFAAVALLRLPVPAVLAIFLPLSIWLGRSGSGEKPEDAR